jgi:hypothetical protein
VKRLLNLGLLNLNENAQIEQYKLDKKKILKDLDADVAMTQL